MVRPVGLEPNVGCDPWTIDRVILGHIRTKIERAYMPTRKGAPLDEARAGLAAWAELLDGIVNTTQAAEGGTL